MNWVSSGKWHVGICYWHPAFKTYLEPFWACLCYETFCTLYDNFFLLIHRQLNPYEQSQQNIQRKIWKIILFHLLRGCPKVCLDLIYIQCSLGDIILVHYMNTVEPHYFKLSREMKNSSKQWEFKMADSKWLKDKSKGSGFEFEIMRNSK